MRRLVPLAVLACMLIASPLAFGQVIFDNASTLPGAGRLGLVTHPGQGFNGADASALTPPDNTFGYTANTATAFRLADNAHRLHDQCSHADADRRQH
jgi:hypothetical protein